MSKEIDKPVTFPSSRSADNVKEISGSNSAKPPGTFKSRSVKSTKPPTKSAKPSGFSGSNNVPRFRVIAASVSVQTPSSARAATIKAYLRIVSSQISSSVKSMLLKLTCPFL